MYSTARWTNDLLLTGLNHPFIYAINNPLRFIDPLGLQAGDGTDNSGDYNRYRICPENPIGGKICEVCIDLACKVSMSVCCTIEQQACLGAVVGNPEKENECRNKFIECLGKVRKPKLPKGPGDGEI